MARRQMTVALAAVMLIAAAAVAETSWPGANADEGQYCTYPNQGRRLVRNGDYLHLIYDMYLTTPYNYYDIRYTNSANLGSNWISVEKMGFGSGHNRDYLGSLAVDGGNCAWAAAAVAWLGEDWQDLYGTLREGRNDYVNGLIWGGDEGGHSYEIVATSSVISPSDQTRPMVYTLASVRDWYQSTLLNTKLLFFAWDTADGQVVQWCRIKVDSVYLPSSDNNLYGSIAVSSNTVSQVSYDTIHIAYQKKDGSTFKVYYIKSNNEVRPYRIRNNNDPTWSSATQLSTASSPTSEPATNPSIEFDSGCDTVLVAWRGPNSNSDVYRTQRKIGSGWATPWNVSSNSSYESDYPTLSTRYGVGWHEETQSNYDPRAWLDNHLVWVKTTGGDSTSKYPHIAAQYSADPYYVDCHTAWTEKTASSTYRVWYKKYRYIPDKQGGGGNSAGWVRLDEGRPVLALASNPSVGRADFVCYLPEAGPCLVEVFDVKGRAVRTLGRIAEGPGAYCVSWDGRDLAGRPVPAGTYYCRLSNGRVTSARVLTLLN